MPYQVYLAVGSNLGDCYQNIAQALKLLCDANFDPSQESSQSSTSSTLLAEPPTREKMARVITTSWLYQTAPMYVVDQPSFWNGAVHIETTLSPTDLLHRIKRIEEHLGRNQSSQQIRHGPRPVDLDILFYLQRRKDADEEEKEDDDGNNSDRLDDLWQHVVVQDPPHLMIPHVSMAEREFVLQPLCDMTKELRHPLDHVTVHQMYQQLQQQKTRTNAPDHHQTSNATAAAATAADGGAVRVLPLPRGRCLSFDQTSALIMGIVNVTPDSFSDVGQLYDSSVEVALQRALDMERHGANVVDIGGESTRPGAKEVAISEELERTIPLIQKLRQGTVGIGYIFMEIPCASGS